MKLADLVTKADQILTFGATVLATQGRTSWGGSFVSEEGFSQFRASGLAFLRTVFGHDHPLYKDFDHDVENPVGADVRHGMGVLQAAREEITGGWLTTVTGIVSAQLFADMLEMAAYLLTEHYKDAAAVLTGGVLEEHLRQLCRKHDIDVDTIAKGSTVPKKADALNAELAAASVYNKLDQKSVTGWLDLRNKAAHARYTEYTEEQVILMNRGVTDFIARHSL